jgi:hypothetical protein
MSANAPILHINSLTIDDQENGNGNGQLDPGEEVEMTINYTNTGHAIAYDIDVYLEGQSGFIEITNPSQHFESIGFLGVFNKTYTVTVEEESPEGICVHFMNELTMGDFWMQQDFPRKISAKCEDFETGDFSKFSWEHSGNLPWDITYQYVYEGNYCIKSGPIGHNQSSEVSLAYHVMEADSIVFFRKVSSEAGDKLKFYINDNLIEEWSGTTGGWKRQAYAVSSGNKTFKWVYEKNNSGSTGADCAWLDFIVLPPPMALTIWAGPNDKSCSGDSFQLIESYGTDYTTIDWNTSGTGTFDDNSVMHPVYTPGLEDLTNGTVELSLQLTDDEGNSVLDDMILEFIDIPEKAATPQGPEQVDPTITPTSEYTTEEMENVTGYNWYMVPEYAGTIIGIGTSATVSWSPDFIGTASITVAGENACGEGEISGAIEVTVNMVGIDEQRSDGLNLAVYPNPVSGLLNIRFSDGIDHQVSIRVFNILGEKVMDKSYSSVMGGQIQSLDLSALPKGMYILSVTGDHEKYDQKIIVK